MKIKKNKKNGTGPGKWLLLCLIATILCLSMDTFAQTPPKGPPPPPPPPGELFKKINPFKKHKKDTTVKKIDTAQSTGQSGQVSDAPPPPPPPPNPLNLFKKKSKKDTTKKQ